MDNLWPLTWAKWRDLSNHTRISTIQSRTQEKKAKNHVILTWQFPWKSCSTATHLPFLSANSNIPKAFLKTFPMKIKPTKCPAREKKWGKKSKKRGKERKRKVQCRPELSEPKYKCNTRCLRQERRVNRVRLVASVRRLSWWVDACALKCVSAH